MTRIFVEVKKGFRKHQECVPEKSSRLDGKASRLNNVSGARGSSTGGKQSTGFPKKKLGSRLDQGVDWFPEEQTRQSTC